MPQKIIWLILSLVLLLGISSCDKKVDAFRCILITVDENGAQRSLDNWYWYCLNPMTNDEKTIAIQDTVKCIRENGLCKWVATDVLEEKKIKDHYSNQCNK